MFEVPFIVYRYNIAGKDYAFAVDAINGSVQAGTKPLSLGGFLDVLTSAIMSGPKADEPATGKEAARAFFGVLGVCIGVAVIYSWVVKPLLV